MSRPRLLAIPAHAALLVWLTCTSPDAPPPERIRELVRTRVDVITVPAPIVVERVVSVPSARPSCPPPRRDATSRPATLPEQIAYVQPAITNAGWVAAWNDRHVYLSMDAGASWQRRLDGGGVVRDVSFDCFGRAIVVRGDRIGIRDGEVEHWRPLPGLRLTDDDHHGRAEAVVLGGGPDVVIIGHALRGTEDPWATRLAVSHDLGATWRHHDLADHWEGGSVRGRQHEDGTVLAMIPLPDCMSDYPWLFRWKDGELAELDALVDVELGIFGDRLVSARATQRIGGDDTHDLPAVDVAWPRVVEGPRPILVTPTTAYRVAGTRVTPLPWAVDADDHGHVADAAGRLWSVRCGQPRVATRAVPAPCPPEPPTD